MAMSKYTHVHYSFADYYGNNVQLDKYASKQFEDFKSLAGVKKILSFGGWVLVQIKVAIKTCVKWLETLRVQQQLSLNSLQIIILTVLISIGLNSLVESTNL